MKQIYFIVCIGCCVVLFATFIAVNKENHGASILQHEMQINDYMNESYECALQNDVSTQDICQKTFSYQINKLLGTYDVYGSSYDEHIVLTFDEKGKKEFYVYGKNVGLHPDYYQDDAGVFNGTIIRIFSKDLIEIQLSE